MTIYLWAEHARLSGRVCHGVEAAGDDAFLWGSGTPEELTAQAREELEACAPRTAANAFRARCALAVLDFAE